MNSSDMLDQTSFLATLVATKTAIERFQFIMNSSDMTVQITFIATAEAA